MGPCEEALDQALQGEDVVKSDIATIALARKLAQEIDVTDDALVIEKLSPRFLATLTSLQMTPASRAAAKMPTPQPVTTTTGGDSTSATVDIIALQRAYYGTPRA